jgi:hypothetical protein
MDTLIGADTIYYIQYKPDEIATLITIAQQCPLSGGKAVYEARATLQAENIKFHYSDDACEFIGDAKYCCYADTVKFDTVYCLGTDINGNKQYQFVLNINHKCHSGNTFSLSTSVGSIGSLSSTNLEQGENLIYGVYTCSSTISNLVCSINFQAESNPSSSLFGAQPCV